MVWRPKSPMNKQEANKDHRVKGKMNEDFMEWLPRSLICTSNAPRDLDALFYLLKDNYGPIEKVTALSEVKYILTFASSQEMNEALENPRELNDWFCDIKPWTVYEYSDSRRVWVDIIGVPPHGWLWENFESCINPWGRLLSLTRCISSTNQFENMRALILTDTFRRIEGELLLDIQNCSFKIFIREINSHLISPSSTLESNGVGGLYSSECDSSKEDDDDDDGCHDSNVNTPNNSLNSTSPTRVHASLEMNLCQFDGDRSQRGQSEGFGALSKQLLSNEINKEAGALNVVGAHDQEKELNNLKSVLVSDEALNMPLAAVPIINDEQLINATMALGNDVSKGLEKSVEVLNENSQYIGVKATSHPNQDDLSNDQVSENNLSPTSSCDSVINARFFIAEKAIEFGKVSGFMRPKKNTNTKKHF